MTTPTPSTPANTATPGAQEELLVRGLGLRQLTANIFNYTVGSGIFVLPAIVAAALGPPALLAYLLCAVIIGMVVMIFAEAGSRVTVTGGPYAYVRVGLGPLPGFVAGILTCMTDISAAGAVSSILAGILARAVGVEGALVQGVIVAILLISFAVINVRGLGWGARLVELCTAAKLIPLFFFIIVGAFFVKPANLRWDIMPSASAVARTAGLLIFAFAGIEAALLPSGEVKNPTRTVPRAAMYALGFVTLMYLAVQGVALGVLGPALGNDKVAPLATAAGTFAGSPGRTLVLIGAGISMFGWLAGSVLAGPRALFALSRDGFLPGGIAKVHARYRTPYIAVILYVSLALALALSGTFEQLAILGNLSAIGLYILSAISVWQLRKRDVQSDGAPFLMPGGALIPVLACIAMIWVAMETVTRREVIAFAIVAVIAVVLYRFRVRQAS